ncbi:MAG: MBL fold metallo-hydrolase [Bacteroidetes bacterium]|nr:MBL fold metallo-hydrolase [Bacteroidota bacterium]
MSLYFASLNSGSNGNCYYIGNETESVLIDAGISCRETEKRMGHLGLDIRNIRAIFITHEHTDHTRGAEVLSRRHNIPVYITEATRCSSRLMISTGLYRNFSSNASIHIGQLCVSPFPKQHDASEPHSFTISSNGLTVGVFTDIGSECEHVSRHFSHCNAAFLETNYDEKMLANGRYPLHLKRRISGLKGHLSNNQALDIFLKHRSPQLKILLLSHLSAENNHPQLAYNIFHPHANGTRIVVASRYVESEVYVVS